MHVNCSDQERNFVVILASSVMLSECEGLNLKNPKTYTQNSINYQSICKVQKMLSSCKYQF